jgi:hypothetical protein
VPGHQTGDAVGAHRTGRERELRGLVPVRLVGVGMVAPESAGVVVVLLAPTTTEWGSAPWLVKFTVTVQPVRYVGASNFRAWELMKALGIQEREHFVRFASVQPSHSLADRVVEDELVPCLLDQGVVIAYSPLAGGVLTGKYGGGEAPPPGSRALTAPRFASRILDEEYLALAAGVTEMPRELRVTPS